MFKVDPRAPYEAMSPDGAESDDNISLTSTLPDANGSDQEYEVENILAEQLTEDGVTYYLVEWTGFQLHESTWEPEANLGDELKAMWEETKAKQATGELEPFDVQKYVEACNKAEEEKKERHRRRNAKRKKLGLPLTPPFAGDDSSDGEAVEDPSLVESTTPHPTTSRRPPSQQQIFKGIPSSGSTPLSNAADSNSARTPPGTPGSSRPRNADHERRSPITASSAPSTKQSSPTQPPSTGYPGTARKQSRGPKAPAVAAVPTIKPASGVRKTLKAKKSAVRPAGNIFTSGKTRKSRPDLRQAMSDPSKEPRFFCKHRHRRLAEKRSRDTEDVAPDVSKVRLFDVTSIKRSSSGFVHNPIQQAPQNTVTPVEPAQDSALVSPRSTLANPEVSPPKKKRRSVRFLDEDGSSDFVQEPEPMDLESRVDGPSSSSSQDPPRNGSLPSAATKLSRDENSWKSLEAQDTQSSTKKLKFGLSSVESIFTRLPLNSPAHAWLSDFLAKETLDFEHVCFAKTVAVQIAGLVGQHLASGSIVPKEDERDLEQVTAYLTSGLLGLYCGQPGYNILVYPTKCEEWKSILPLQESASPSETASLGYFIFASTQDCRLMLPPLDLLSQSQPAIRDSEKRHENRGIASERQRIVKRLFDFDYAKLLPVTQKPLPFHAFFLAFPKSRGVMMQALYHWYVSHGWHTF